MEVIFVDGVGHGPHHLVGPAQGLQGLSGVCFAHDAAVEFLGRRMQDSAEHRGVHLLAHLVVRRQTGHRMEVEAQRAGDVAEQRRGRKGRRMLRIDETFESLHHPLVLGHFDRFRTGEVDIHAHLDPPHRDAAFIIELVDIAARFAGRLLVGVRAVEHVHAPGPLDQAIEIVGIDSLVVFGRGQREGRTQVVGHERSLRHAVAGEVVVVHRENDDVVEIEVAGLQNTHHLHPFQRLALERDADRLEVAAQQRGVDLRFDRQVAGVERVAQFDDLFGDHRQEFAPLAGIVAGIGRAGHGIHHRQQPLRELLPAVDRREDARQQCVAAQPRRFDRDAPFAHDLLRQRAGHCRVAPRHVGMVQQSRNVGVVEGAACTFRSASRLQRQQTFHERIGQGLLERIAHRHVHLADLLGQGIEQRQEQVFVGQDHSSPLVEGTLLGIFAQNLSRIFALHGVRDGRHDGQFLFAGHVVVRETGARREKFRILAHEHAGFLLGVVLIVSIVVPIEIGLRVGREKAEKNFFALRKRIETGHDVSPRFGEDVFARQDAVGGGPLHHTAIGDAQPAQPLAVAFVDGAQRLPDRQEPAFLLRQIGFGSQRRPETQNAELRRREVGDVGFHLLDFRQVAEKLRGIDAVFVDRVEVRQQHLAPEVEPVERLGMELRVDFVEFGYQTQAVARRQTRNLGRQLVDRAPRGLPHGPFGYPAQRIGEEKPCAPRGKEHGPLRELLAVACIEIARHLFQKSRRRHDPTPVRFGRCFPPAGFATCAAGPASACRRSSRW